MRWGLNMDLELLPNSSYTYDVYIYIVQITVIIIQ